MQDVYEKLGITNIGELLEHYPRGYLDLTGSLTIKDASDEHPCAIRATVTQKSATRPIRKGLTVSKVRATDMERDLMITFFNGKYTVDALEKINIDKAAILYDFLDNSQMFRATVENAADRSLMNVPFVTDSDELNAKFIKEATAKGFVNLKGHRSVGGMRASIYNAMPIEGVEKLVEFMAKFEEENS